MAKIKTKKITKSLVRLMVLTISLTLALSQTVLAMTMDFKSDYKIGQNTTYYAVDGENSGGLQKVNYVEYKPNTSVSPMIAYGKGFYGRSTINSVTSYLESQGKEVIAGINADFFDLTSGIPIGLVVKDGIFISSNVGQYAVGFKSDGTAVIGKPTSAMTLKGASGSVTVECFNKTRSTYTVCLYDSDWGTETKINSKGYNILFERVEDTDVTINSEIKLKVVSKTNESTSTPIASNQMVLSVSEKGPLDRIPNWQVGEEVTFSVKTADTNWQDVEYAVGGKIMLNDGAVDVSGSPTGLAARSAIGTKADGTVVLYEVDGRQNGYSVGLTPTQLAAEMKSLGCTNAINLDGGGSSAMVIQMPGDKDSKIVNKPSDGTPRTCANYIFLVNNTSATGNIKNLHVYPETSYVLTGGKVKLNTKATDDNFYPTTTPSGLTYSVSNSMGTVSDGVFTAGTKTGVVQINASSGEASGSGKVFIISALDGLSVTKANSTTAISSLTAAGGEKVALSAKGTFKGQTVAASGQSVKWSVSGNVGTVSTDGVFTANGTGTSGKITATYGSLTKSVDVKVTVGAAPTQNALADFESSQPFTSENAALTKTTTFDQVCRGKSALKVAYDFAQNTNNNLTYTSTSIGSNKYVVLFAKGDNSGLGLTANFTDQAGATQTAQFSPTLSGDKYIALTAEIPQGSTNFTGISLNQGNKVSGAIYLDQIMLSTSATADTSTPTIAFSKAPTTVTPGSAGDFIVKVTDDNGKYTLDDKQISVTVDGKNAAFTSNKTTGNIAFGTGTLSAGIHRVTVTGTDNFGNMARKSIDVQAKADKETASSFTDVSGHWAKDYIDFVAKRDLLKGEVDKKGNSLFFPKRNLTRGEFAVIMARYLNLETPTDVTLPFADLDKIPSWALDSVKAVYAAGIMNGSEYNGKTYFYPKDNIVRQEVMTVIGKSLPRGYGNTTSKFTDASSIAAWALPHINYLVTLDIVGGYKDGTILPKNNISRAEIAKILYALY